MQKLSLPWFGFLILLLVTLSFVSTPTWADEKKANAKKNVLDSAGIERLKKEAGGKTKIAISPATGGARFISFRESSKVDMSRSAKSASFEEKAQGFLREYGSVFGLRNAQEELALKDDKTDRLGNRHLSYIQQYRGVPVFAGELKAHFDAAGQLKAVNGNIVPEIDLNAAPSKTSEEAADAALGKVLKEHGKDKSISVQSTRLNIYRTGLAQGVPGKNYLVWQIEVGNKGDVREFVFIDAHTGALVDQITGVMDALNRRAYDGQFENPPAAVPVPSNYPLTPFWVEGQTFPTGLVEADNMITSSKETYDLYKNAFGRDSYDGSGAVLDAIFNRGYQCPNASWNGAFISFCNGLTTDDVTGHEWTHAYTEFTHNLIYNWQPGALNEAYSDIFGETIDRINGRGTDTPNTPRLADACSTFGGTPPITFRVNSPAAIAGTYFATPTIAKPPLPVSVTGDVALASPANGCTAITGVSGKVAIIDWALGTCGSVAKTTNAFNAGAIGAIIVADPAGLIGLTGSASIATVQVSNADGALIKANLPANVSIIFPAATDNSVRWLIGEDDTAAGLSGPLRDMWNPRCFNNPGKVSDQEYSCSAADNGGVHGNSGVPNHAFTLIVDGGKYNAKTIKGIGLTKAAHVYFRAMNVYQTSNSDFSDHADAIEQSAFDLLFDNLPDLKTGKPSGQRIGILDLFEIHKALTAVELRKTPNCDFGSPLLDQDPPPDPVCGPGLGRSIKLKNGFEGSTSQWSIGRQLSDPATFTGHDWKVVDDLPDNRRGRAFFVDNPNTGNCITTSEAGVRSLTSPPVQLPASIFPGSTLAFNHWVSTETGVDGAQLSLSVNGGPFNLITVIPSNFFVFNGYNFILASAAQGSTNPRGGQQAWSGSDNGTVEGTWGRTIVDLTGLVSAGQTIRFRWDMSTDCGSGKLGWYVDDVTMYACEADADADGIADSSDLCPNSDQITNPVVVIGTGKNSNTGVTNKILENGCTLQQKIDECAANSNTQGQFVSCVSNLARGWRQDGIISLKEELRIILAALTAKNWK